MDSKGKRILMVVDGFPQLSETFILNQIITLKELGYTVQVMANRKVGPPYHHLIDKYNLLDDLLVRPRIFLGRFKRLGAFIKYFFKSVVLNPTATFRSFNISYYGKSAINGELLISLYRYLKVEKPDLIHCHFGQNGVLAEKVSDVLGWKVPFFVTFHGYDTIPENIIGINYTHLAERANAVFVNSKFLRSKVIALGFKKEKIRIIPVGLLPSQTVHEKQPVEKNKFLCLTVARLVEFKGIEYSLQALSLFHKAHPEEEFSYVIIGAGKLKEPLEKLAISLGLGENVIFTGALSQDKVQDYYRKASLFMLTGITTNAGQAETQGLVYQEAASFGLPVLASDAGGAKEYVIDGESGLIAKEKDIHDIHEKFASLYFDTVLRKRLGAGGKQNSAHFNQFTLTKKIIEVYESVL